MLKFTLLLDKISDIDMLLPCSNELPEIVGVEVKWLLFALSGAVNSLAKVGLNDVLLFCF